ncbi:DUF6371 domain-containing protein [Flavobacterium chuncheonense]|uniref:DUF6371 domain-containing protein n=1 Tax=Flavobacterium chuncheonense TaxID=2026653 RepID=A0ABW5YJU6_9FLAO
MLIKNNHKLSFDTKRDYSLITPCCNKKNKDGKFVNYKNLSKKYGYCHSCGIATLPPISNKKKSEYGIIKNNHIHRKNTVATSCNENTIEQKYIPEDEIWKGFHLLPENNLLQYFRKKYGDIKTQDAKEIYAIGTSNDGGTIFWNINIELQVQKNKISYYNEEGRRTNKFKVPFKNEDGYLSCLYGEHLLSYPNYKNSKVVLVESEKTAIDGYINMPQYAWLAYGGINGLTAEKAQVLTSFNVILVPDLSENAVAIAAKKVYELRQQGINISLCDMTEGKSDEELKKEGIYNYDLEDFIRKINIII